MLLEIVPGVFRFSKDSHHSKNLAPRSNKIRADSLVEQSGKNQGFWWSEGLCSNHILTAVIESWSGHYHSEVQGCPL